MSRRNVPPLKNGEHLDQKTFHERYEAMPEHVRAELIGGTVFLTSHRKASHGRASADLNSWIAQHNFATPGTDCVDNATHILGTESEPEPDSSLFILPECGGQIDENESGYLTGPPDLLAEIGESTESIDLHAKKADYEKAGVREYIVASLPRQNVFWFVRTRGKFKEIAPDGDGIHRSQIFPGLWLDPVALVRRNTKRLLAVLEKGLGSPEHAEFVKKLNHGSHR
jgi:hypothetical protein